MPSEFWNYRGKISYSEEKAKKIQLGATEISRATLWCLLPGQHIHPHVHAGCTSPWRRGGHLRPSYRCLGGRPG